MNKFLLLLPFLAVSLAGCSLGPKKDSGDTTEPASQSEEVVDMRVYGVGDKKDEVLTVGFDIPAGEYWIKAASDNYASGYSIYSPRGFNAENEYENRLFYKSVFEGEFYLTVLKTGQFLKLDFATAQNAKVDQGITVVKNGMFKVGEHIQPVEGMVRVKVCAKAEERVAIKPNFTVYTYNEKTSEFTYDPLDSKSHGVFESDDTQYHMIENPPVGSYIELVGLQVG